jgi:hypothetical protein
MMILFISAYYFDHLGVLSLAITNLAAWAGITITPLSILEAGNFADDHLIYTGIILAVILLLIARLTQQRRLKPHFETTYANFGVHLFFIATLAGIFTHDETYGLWFMGLAAFALYGYIQAMARRSFYFILVIVLYFYIALSTVIVRLLSTMSGNSNPIFPGLLYFILSAVGTAVLLVRLNRQLKSHDSL